MTLNYRLYKMILDYATRIVQVAFYYLEHCNLIYGIHNDSTLTVFALLKL